VTVQYGGRVVSKDLKQASVIEEVPFGLMRRMLIVLVDEPVTEEREGGSESDMAARNRG